MLKVKKYAVRILSFAPLIVTALLSPFVVLNAVIPVNEFNLDPLKGDVIDCDPSLAIFIASASLALIVAFEIIVLVKTHAIEFRMKKLILLICTAFMVSLSWKFIESGILVYSYAEKGICFDR